MKEEQMDALGVLVRFFLHPSSFCLLPFKSWWVAAELHRVLAG
jgi:hypothetical protein